MSQSLAQWLRVLRQAPALGGGRWQRLPGAAGCLPPPGRGVGGAALPGWALVAAGPAQQGPGRARGRHDAGDGAGGNRLRRRGVCRAGGAPAGAPPGDYPGATGAVIARSSRLVEPILAPWLRSLVAERQPRRVLDVGCGTGSYLVHAATAGGPKLTGLGVDLDAAVVDLARRRLADAGLAERFGVRPGDVRTVQLPAASFDLVLLFQNIYYFAEDQRPDLLRRLRGLLAPGGALLLASLFAGRWLAAAHDDLLFRATAGCGPLPRRQQLDHQLHNAGFTTTRWVQLIPLESFHAVVAQR